MTFTNVNRDELFFYSKIRIFEDCLRSNMIIRSYLTIFVQNSNIFALKKAKPTIELQKFKIHKKRDWLLVSKVDFTFLNSHRN